MHCYLAREKILWKVNKCSFIRGWLNKIWCITVFKPIKLGRFIGIDMKNSQDVFEGDKSQNNIYSTTDLKTIII